MVVAREGRARIWGSGPGMQMEVIETIDERRGGGPDRLHAPLSRDCQRQG